MNQTLPQRLWIALLVPLAVFLIHSFYYYPFFVDDAFISLRYSDRLLTGHGLTWNDGEHVEGYSNLSWVLLTALLGKLGFDLVGAGRVICLVSSLAAMGALIFYWDRRTDGKPVVLGLTLLTFALTAPVAIWSIGGLEGTLVMALLAWAFVLSSELLEAVSLKTAVYTGILLGFVCLTRPEGAFFTAAIAGSLFIFTRTPRLKLLPSLIVICAISFLFFIGQVLFRLHYYGDWLPNTYYAKVAGLTYARLINGSMYSIKSLASFLPVFLVIFMHFDRFVKQERYTAKRWAVFYFLALTMEWITSLTLAGGDMEPGYRHILLVVPLILLMLMEALTVAYDSGKVRNTHIFCGYLIICFFWLQCIFDENIKAKDEQWEWQMKELGEWLGEEYSATQPLVAISNAGAIPYYSKLPSLDMYGINDSYLTHHRGPMFGNGFIGHELFNGDYVLSRKPDIIVFFTGVKRAVYGSSFDKDPEFLKFYTPVEVKLPSYTPTIWIRKDSTKVHHLP